MYLVALKKNQDGGKFGMSLKEETRDLATEAKYFAAVVAAVHCA